MFRFVLILTCFLFVSCASEQTVTVTKKQNKLDFKDRYAGGFEVSTDEEGNVQMKSDKRSSFDDKRQASLGKSYNKKAYKAKGFEKKDWRNNEVFKKQKFDSGEKGRFNKKSRFADDSSRYQGDQFRNKGKAYSTDRYKSNSARGSGEQVAHVVNKQTQGSRRNYDNYSIIDQAEHQRRSIQETRSLLGRSE